MKQIVEDYPELKKYTDLGSTDDKSGMSKENQQTNSKTNVNPSTSSQQTQLSNHDLFK